MFTELFRTLHNALARLNPSLKTVTYACDRCGLRAEITDQPERITQWVLPIVMNHPCRPKHKTL